MRSGQVLPQARALRAETVVEAEAAGGALVGLGGVGETVGQHPLAPRQGGGDDGGHELGAGRLQDAQLGHGGGLVVGVQQHRAERLTERRAAGLPGGQHRGAARAQVARQQGELRGLAAAFHALEADEAPLAHAGIVAMPPPARPVESRESRVERL